MNDRPDTLLPGQPATWTFRAKPRMPAHRIACLIIGATPGGRIKIEFVARGERYERTVRPATLAVG